MKIKIILFLLFLFLNTKVNSQQDFFYTYSTVSYLAQGREVIYLNDSSLAVIGDYTNVTNSSDKGIFISKFDTLGNTSWMYSFNNFTSIHGNSLKQLPNDDIIYSFSSNQGLIVGRIDILGNQVWQKILTSSGGTSINFPQISITSDGYVLLTAFSISSQAIIKLDLQGSIIWSKLLKGNGFISGEIGVQYDFFESINSGYILVGSARSIGTGTPEAFICKIDTNGNIIWSNIVGNTETKVFEKAVELDDGSILALGFSKNITKDILLAKFDSLGNLHWIKKFGDSLDNRSFSILNNNYDIYIKGYSLPSQSFVPSNSFELKLDSSGVITHSKRMLGKIYSNSSVLSSDGGLFSIGTFYSSQTSSWLMSLIKTNSLNELYCNNENFTFPSSNLNVTIDHSFLMFGSFTASNTTLNSNSISLTKETNCEAWVGFVEDESHYFSINYSNFNIYINNPKNKLFTIRIYNSQAQLILERKNLSSDIYELNKTIFSTGMYFYHITSGKILESGKIIIH